ncbi:MAG: hypothetical protein ABI361_02615 [Nitrososphaera sp.]
MKILDGKRTGSITVFEDTLMIGEVFGDLILNHGHLELKGKVLGNVHVRKGSCRVLGIIRGNLENESGDVEIFGTVHGKVITKSGYTYVNPGSKVGSIESSSVNTRLISS